MKLCLGSIVQLKSCGVNMTVDCLLSDDRVLCVWQDNNQNEHRGIYAITSLIIIR
jgi:uncharacterized protein YodC (DUF2158 family)